MHNPTDRIVHTMAFVIPVVENWLEQEIEQWVHQVGSFRLGNGWMDRWTDEPCPYISKYYLLFSFKGVLDHVECGELNW